IKVVTVRPGADLTVIGKVIPRSDKVKGPIGTGRVAGLRDSDRLVVRRCGRAGKRKLREDPAIRHSIVESESVSIVVTRGDATERREERAQLQRRTAWHAVFVKDPNSAAVHNLHVLVRADRALRIRWRGISHAHALEDEDRRRNVHLEEAARSKDRLQ